MIVTLLKRAVLMAMLSCYGVECTAQEAQRGALLIGNVHDPNGVALAGVRVDISTAAPRVGHGLFCPSCYLDCAKWTTTDDKGHFQFVELNNALKFRLVLSAPSRTTLQTDWIDPWKSPVKITLLPRPDDLDPSRLVTGIVTNSRGNPVAGALVAPHGAKSVSRRWWGNVENVDIAVTDEEGRFSTYLPDELLAVDIEVTSAGYCGTQVPLLEPGKSPATVVLPDGARVVGKLVHNGQPARAMDVAVVQVDRSAGDGIFIAAVGAVTNDDGSFQFDNLPASQKYCIYSVVGEARMGSSQLVLAAKTFLVPADGQQRDLGILEVTQPITVRGHVQRLDGKPLPNDLKLLFGRDPPWDLVAVSVNADGTFVAKGLPPETYEIRLSHQGLLIADEKTRFQSLGPNSFGIRLHHSIDDLAIPVRGE
ncbi:MAG: hypothetical protein R3E01_21685 [Pirellulaceae bacterium]|nr:hypothetical protein [Planctomycetales bacterium]